MTTPINYKREYEATFVTVNIPNEAWSSDEEEQNCADAWNRPFPIVLDTCKAVWVTASYAHGTPKGVTQVVDAAGGKFDHQGNCVLSVPAGWCKFHTDEEAESIEQAINADERLLSYAR